MTLPGHSLRFLADLDPTAPVPSLDEMQDILDIRTLPPFFEPASLWPYVLAALACLLLLALGGYLYRRARKKGPAAPTPGETLTAALAELESLDDRSCYLHLEAALRGYLEESYGLPARSAQLEELWPALAGLGMPRALRGELAELLARIEPVKFAGAAVSPEQRAADLALLAELARSGGQSDDSRDDPEIAPEVVQPEGAA